MSPKHTATRPGNDGMQFQNRPSPLFLADDVSLDFLNTVATPRATRFEWLETGCDLLDWLVLSGLVSMEEREALENSISPTDIEQVTSEIRDFREKFRGFVQAVTDKPQILNDHPMIDDINSLLRQSVQHSRIEPAPVSADRVSPFVLSTKTRLLSAQDILPRIAAACAQLVCEADFHLVRNCEGATCTMLFLDVSKNHKRRWCAMEVCGNRAKAAAHRKKNKQSA